METIRIAPWVSWVDEAASLVLFDGRDASYHALNQSASAIWRGLGASGDLATVAAAIAAEYGLATDEADAAVQAFVGGALAKGLLLAD